MKRKYKLYKEETKYDDIISNLLYNRGIKEIEEYKNAGYFEINDKPLSMIQEAIRLLNEYDVAYHRGTDVKIGILVDCDCDGFCSASMLYSFLTKSLKLPCVYYMHKGKAHGLEKDILNEIIESEINLLFIPDAGTNDTKEIDYLNSKGIDIIILDHHVIERENQEYWLSLYKGYQFTGSRRILVNQYLSDYPNKELSGACVTWKFIETYKHVAKIVGQDYSDLAMLSLIGDNMDIKEIENRAIINLGLENINNLMFLALLNKQSYSIGNELHLKPVDLSFYIVPLINAVIRVGTQEEKDLLFRGFCELDTGKQYECKKKNKETRKYDIEYEGFFEHIARVCAKIKARQKKIIDKDFEYCLEGIKQTNLDSNEVIVFNANNNTDKNLTGLTAMKIADYFNKPTLILNPESNTDKVKECVEKFGAKEILLSGSMRNIDYGLDNLQETLLSTDAFEYVSGHENAAGVSIRRSKVKDMIDKMNSIILDGNHIAECYVDDILDFEDIDASLINELVKFEQYVGTGLPEVKLLVKNIQFTSNDVEIMGKEKDTTKIKLNDIAIMKFKSKEFADKVSDCWEDCIINIVCKPSINMYKGESTCQLIIEDYEFVE